MISIGTKVQQQPVVYWGAARVSELLGTTSPSLKLATLRGEARPAPAVWISETPGWLPFDSADSVDDDSRSALSLMSIAEFARHLGLEEATLKSYRRDGKLPAPDGFIESRPGWLRRTVERWNTDRTYHVARRGRRPAALETFASIPEVAEALGISQTTVRKRLADFESALADGAALDQPQRPRGRANLAAPSVKIGSVYGWSRAAVKAMRAGQDPDHEELRRFYTRAEIAGLYGVSANAVVQAHRAGRWPTPDAKCSQTFGWSLKTIVEVRGPLPADAGVL